MYTLSPKYGAFLFKKVFYICPMAQKFRKRPVVIEAVQWKGNNQSEVIQFCDRCYFTTHGKVKDLYIATLEGDMKGSVGDYIIKGVAGEFYACKPDIFAATYENV
jgi:hypothetical protein